MTREEIEAAIKKNVDEIQAAWDEAERKVYREYCWRVYLSFTENPPFADQVKKIPND